MVCRKPPTEKQFTTQRDTFTGQRIVVRQIRLWRECRNSSPSS